MGMSEERDSKPPVTESKCGETRENTAPNLTPQRQGPSAERRRVFNTPFGTYTEVEMDYYGAGYRPPS
jgi:hypothetical protein